MNNGHVPSPERNLAAWAMDDLAAAVTDGRSWMFAYENPDGSGEILFYVCADADDFRARVKKAT